MDYILEYCRKFINRFAKMNDSEIYDWICENFWINDYEVARKCSFIIFEESRD